MIESFETDWLALREPADAAARDRGLARRAGEWLSGRSAPYAIVDLGAGGGNNPAWLAPRLPGPQRWNLVDHDAELLERATARLASLTDAEGRPVDARTDRRDLADLDPALPEGTDLATASALFDLCPADWIDRFAARCASVGCAALLALTVDGRWRFVRPDGRALDADVDATMRGRLDAHQHRDKGLGPALGGDAAEALVGAFRAHGFEVRAADSPWRLGATSHPGLAMELMRGWRRALREQAPAAGREIDDWWAERSRAVERGALELEVGHVDVWAEPPAR